jgi:flagellar hook-associated protein 1 FlgK
VSQTRDAQQALSGVNLDEEAANLVRYQQAYQASGRVLQVAAQLFDTILEIGQ